MIMELDKSAQVTGLRVADFLRTVKAKQRVVKKFN